MIRFHGEESGVTILFEDNVVTDLLSYCQGKNDVESGGLLFSRLQNAGLNVAIERVSKPTDSDIRTRNRFIPNKAALQEEIESAYADGFHYVGEWHTHPEKSPNPSQKDVMTIIDIFKKSQHQLDYFILVIVGSLKTMDSSYVAIADAVSVRQCRLAREL